MKRLSQVEVLYVIRETSILTSCIGFSFVIMSFNREQLGWIFYLSLIITLISVVATFITDIKIKQREGNG